MVSKMLFILTYLLKGLGQNIPAWSLLQNEGSIYWYLHIFYNEFFMRKIELLSFLVEFHFLKRIPDPLLSQIQIIF